MPSLRSIVIYVPTPLRAPIKHMGTNQNLSNKKFDLRQFLHDVKEFDLFEKFVN